MGSVTIYSILNFKKEIKIPGDIVSLVIIQNISWYSKYRIQVGKEMVESK